MFPRTRHARIERVGLEHHGDAAVLRLLPGHVAAADPDLPPASTSIRPAMAFSSVDLPQPEGPSSTRNSRLRHLEVELLEHADRAEAISTPRMETSHALCMACAHPFTAPAAMPRTNQRPETK